MSQRSKQCHLCDVRKEKQYAASHTSEMKSESVALALPTLCGGLLGDGKHVTNCSPLVMFPRNVATNTHFVILMILQKSS